MISPRRSKRSSYQRLDYRALHSSGTKVVVNESTVSPSESESHSDSDDSQNFNNSNDQVDPLLISQFEELSCKTKSDISIKSVTNESVCEVPEIVDQESVFSSTVIASPEEFLLEEPVEVVVTSETSGDNLQSAIESYQSLLTEESSFEVSASHLSLACGNEHSQKSQCLLSLEANVDSVLETSATSLSDFATPLVNSTLVFDYSQFDTQSNSNLPYAEPSYQEEPSSNLFSTDSITDDSNLSSTDSITDDQVLSSFSKVAYHVRGLTELIKPVLRRQYRRRKSRPVMSLPTTDVELTQRALSKDIDDFIEEYPTDDCESAQEIDSWVSRIEDLRSLYRLRHSEYSKLVDNYDMSDQKIGYEKRIAEVKVYLREAKDRRKLLKFEKSKGESDAQLKSCNFLIKEIDNVVSELSIEFDFRHKQFKDEQITTKKTAIPQIEKKMVGVANSIKELLTHSKDGGIQFETEVNRITAEYDQLCIMKSTYIQYIIEQAESRELSKKELFNAGKLNINLGKFSGYDFKTDIYTFQSEFIDANQLTPKRYHARKLKNNHLEGNALALVKNVEDIDEIWQRLKETFGDPKLLLKRKFTEVDSINDLSKIRNPEKVSNSLSKLINVIRDLLKLAADHDIEDKLYHGDGLDRIYQLMGDERLTKWLTHISDKNLSIKRTWTSLVAFLESDMRIQHQKILIHKKRDEKSDKDGKSSPHSSHFTNSSSTPKCHLCDGEDHVATRGPKGSKLVQYFACKKFVEINPHDRFILIKNKGFCKQCLFPGAGQEKGKHKEGKCQRDYACPDPSHEAHTVRKHVLICQEHRDSEQNKDLLKKYKERFIDRNTDLPAFSKELKLAFLASSYRSSNADNNDEAIFMLQNILVEGKEYCIFYDNGCNQFACQYDAVQRLGSRAEQKVPGPLNIGGVGGTVAVARHGEYEITLPLFNGEPARFTGLCLDQITQKFPVYPLQGAIEDDINQAHGLTGDKRSLPRLPRTVGGLETAFMIGMKHKNKFPKEIFMMPSGLTIMESYFCNPDGSRGVICGPHRIVASIEANANMSVSAFFSQQFQLFRNGYKVNPDISILHCRPDNALGDCYASKSKPLELFQSVEDAGSEILFRCNECRDCVTCKHHENVDNMTVDQEAGQLLIEDSVTIDLDNQRIEATLPMICVSISSTCPQWSHDCPLEQNRQGGQSAREDRNSIARPVG